MKSKSYFMYNFSQIWFIFLFDFNIAKMHIFCSFLKKDNCYLRPNITIIGNQFWKN